MATKARYRKTPVQLWVADKRKEHGLTTADIATMTGVGEAAARGWESRGRPSQEALAILERRFGEMAPAETTENYAELASVLAALIDELEAMRLERAAWIRGAIAALRAYEGGQVPEALLDALEPLLPEPAQR